MKEIAIASKKTRHKNRQLELDTRQIHDEKEDQKRRLKDMEAKQRELINVMLNEKMAMEAENFFDDKNGLMSIQKHSTNEHCNQHADWQQEWSYSTTTILLDNDFSCL